MSVQIRKALDIALKDLIRSVRNRFGLLMMFLVPIILTGIPLLAFPSLRGGGGGGFDMPVTQVIVANLDPPSAQLGGSSAGAMLLQFLQDDSLASLLQVAVAADEASAREAVEERSADVAVVIPADFTAAVLEPERSAASLEARRSANVTLVRDPTLTLGPGIVKGLVSQFVDGFAGAKIAANVVAKQLGQSGATADAEILQSVVAKYVAWVTEQGESRSQGSHPALRTAPPPSKEQTANRGGQMAGAVMIGMMIFFSFFTGATTAGTIVSEDERGTLARLFTTPTAHTAILAGKLAGVFATVLVQVVVLTVLTSAIFGVHWGQPATVALAILGLVIAASSFGILLISLIETTQQLGPVMGGLLTVTGMLGGLFTTGFGGLPSFYETINLLTPQGWAARCWKLSLSGATVRDVAPTAIVLLGMGIVFFAIGAYHFRRRYV